MPIAYQCWEMGVGPAVNASEGSTLRRSSEEPFSNFQMFQTSGLKGQAYAKDVMAVRFSTSPVSPRGLNPTAEACGDGSPKQPAASGSNVTTSSVTTEGDEKVSSGGSAGSLTTIGEAQSRRLEDDAPAALASGGLSRLPGDRALRVKVSRSKPGVVERIVPLNGGSLYGGYMYGSPNKNALQENSSESSSICQASEDSGSCSSDTGGEEAQSAYRGPLTKGSLSALDESLPIKRPGLSKFFGGKSRSFSSLAEVSSVTELAKPNNPYSKRQRMGSFNCLVRDKIRSYPPPTRSSGSSIAKKLPSSGSRNTLAVAVILGGLKEEHNENLRDVPSSARNLDNRSFASRSYSLTDLPHAAIPLPPRRAFAGP